jgi:hypothetical protein
MIVNPKHRMSVYKRARMALNNIKYLNESTSYHLSKNNNPGDLDTGVVLAAPAKSIQPSDVFKVEEGHNKILERELMAIPLRNECILHPVTIPEKLALEDIGLNIPKYAKTYIVKDKDENIKCAFSITESMDIRTIRYMDVTDDEEYFQEGLLALSIKPSGYDLTTNNVFVEECIIPEENISVDDNSASIKLPKFKE